MKYINTTTNNNNKDNSNNNNINNNNNNNKNKPTNINNVITIINKHKASYVKNRSI